jgi:hypothetical protein
MKFLLNQFLYSLPNLLPNIYSVAEYIVIAESIAESISIAESFKKCFARNNLLKN